MNEFNLWDLWGVLEAEIKKTDGETYRGRVICVDEGLEEYGDGGIIVTIENSDGIRGHTAKYIENITIYKDGHPAYKIIKEKGKWQKMTIMQQYAES